MNKIKREEKKPAHSKVKQQWTSPTIPQKIVIQSGFAGALEANFPNINPQSAFQAS